MWRNLFQLYPDSLGAVEQSLEMEARERIVGMHADQSGEGRHRAGVFSLELGEGFGVLCRCQRRKGLVAQRLIGAKRLAAAPPHAVADRTTLEILRRLRNRLAGADAGAQLLVGGLQARGRVDGVAVGGVVEILVAAEIADQRRAGVHADTSHAEIDALGAPALLELLRP